MRKENPRSGFEVWVAVEFHSMATRRASDQGHFEMKKLALLLALIVVTLLACSVSQPIISPPTVQLSDTPTPHLTATALAAQTQTIATLYALY